MSLKSQYWVYKQKKGHKYVSKGMSAHDYGILFTTANTWNQHKFLWTEKWFKKM